MANDKNNSANQEQFNAQQSGGSGSGPVGGVSGVGGMSQVERVQYIQQLQKVSPLARIADAIKSIRLSDLGLSKKFFEQKAELFKSMRSAYQNLREKIGINQHISGLTENVRGVERIKHEMDPGANVDLVDGQAMDKKKGLYVDLDWTPKQKGKIE